ncbi:RHS repeat-associated core domain-containing protein [Ralstonia pseudosolanacearum]|uniref:RHS repeat-associated core domain-containing protein n=1 Tax=Ralstonia pseudosolanacearum TaxID=1310165 RepID=UPI001E282670|nr:RHS repeat-associated core domain-containing protein [Ralstonia pseudosolanacearum]UWD88049.1 hypothetical protein NY025_04760 [Ralstonia pseudosolanacearum]CAH0444766.1 hypothetical protein LMG9673_04459 [Ralstonia pseudosolanacearum]
MKGGWAGGFGERAQDQDALAGSLHMQGGRMPMGGDGWHDGGRWNEGDRGHEGGRWNEGDRWHEGGRHGDYGHHERAPWPPFGHGHGHGGAMGARASSFFYETDAENRIVSMLEAGREGPKPHWYRYDAADRLLADDSRSWNDRRYSYDAADNRTGAFSRQAKQTIVANALNQMQTVNGQPTQYDVAGNLLEDEARQYDWDAEHRLIRIRYKAQAGKETRFGYDGLGRRTVITEVDGTGTTETHYIWCGEVICQKRDANGQLLRAYYPEGEYGPEIGKRVVKADAGIEADEDGDERYGRDRDGDDGKSDQPAETTGSLIYARNHLGSVTDTLTPNGRAVTHTEYGPYGELVKSQGRAEYRADFGYAGMQYHAASGMYLTLFRAYDSGTGRWVSRDPIGERGGFNLYGYVGGSPLNAIDPFGLSVLGNVGAVVGRWGGGVAGAAVGEAIVPTGGGIIGGMIGGRVGSTAGRVAGEWLNDIILSRINYDDLDDDDYADHAVGGRCKGKRGSGGGSPGNNQAQNKQAADAAKAAGGLNEQQLDTLHDAISKRGYGWSEVVDIARQIKNGTW